MNLLRSYCLAVLPQVSFSVFSPKGGNERRPSGFLRLVVLLGLFCLGSAEAWAATCTVSSNADSGANTLRSCLSSYSSGDTINITATGKITLASTLPAITKSVTITGPGAGNLTISGGGTFNVFSISAGTVSISDLKISGGKITGSSGGAISQTAGSLTVTGCEFANNTSTFNGGAIYEGGGSLTVSGSTFTNNSAGAGGAISAFGGLTLANSTFSGNSAGGNVAGAVFATGTTAITNSTFNGNTAGSGGSGGIYFNSGTATIANNLFDGNSPGAAISNNTGTVNASYNVFYNNAGGDCASCTTVVNSVDATADPLALPLTYYGGTTKTFLPQPGSQALCAGSASLATGAGLTTDQRGFAVNPTYTPCAAGSVDAGAVQANYIQVQASNDAGLGASDCQGASCTLRDALALANSNGYGDIDFASGVSSITLSNTGTLTLSGTTGINIIGLGTSTVTVNGGGPASNFSVFTVNANVPALLYGLTISNGNTSSNGGGISNAGTLTVVDSTITSNTAVNGGGIANTGTLEIAESTIAGNSAKSAGSSAYGGGIYSSSGLITVVNTTVAGNSASGNPTDDAGGFYVTGGTTNLSNSIVSANSTANGVDANIGVNGGSFNSVGGNVIGGSTNATNNMVGGTGAKITLSSLQHNGIGATIQTMIPLPGSPVICAGATANIVSGLTTDERGYPLQPAGGYCTASEIDSGAVQTNYTSVNFVQQPAGATSGTSGSVAVNTNMTSPAIIQVLETDTLLSAPNNTDGVNGIPLSLTLTTDNAHLVNGSATTAGAGASAGEATFTNLQVSAAEMNDTLSLAAVTLGSGQLGPLTSDAFNAIGPATVLLVSAPVSTTVGVPFSVTVTAEDAAGNTANGYTGTVHFTSTDTGTDLVLPGDYTFTTGAGQDNGAHTFTNGVTLVTAGSQTVTATDTVTNTITGASGSVTVNKATPTIGVTLTTGSNPSVYGTSLTFTATVTGVPGPLAPTGTVTFDDGAAPLTCTTSPSTLAATGPNTGISTATCIISSLTGGTHQINATYVPGGDVNYLAAGPSANLPQQVNPVAPTTGVTLTTGSSPSVYGTSLTFTATVTGVTGLVAPTGKVTFDDGATLLTCTTSPSNLSATGPNTGISTATCTISSLTGGPHQINATYVPGGDPNYLAAGPSANLPQTVTKLATTVALLSSEPASSKVNDTVTFTATVSYATPPVPASTPTGTVSFTLGGNPIASCTTVAINGGGTWTCPLQTLVTPSAVIGATYNGDGNYATSNAPALTQTVNVANTTVSVASSLPAGSSVNQSVTLTATMSYPSGPVVPTGTVVYSDGATTLCTFPAAGSSAFTGGVVPSCTVPLSSQGTHTIKAVFNPSDSNFNGSNGAFSQTVNTTTTTTFVVSSPDPSAVNQSVTFTATVTPAFTAGTALPTGTVTYQDATTSTTLCLAKPLVGGAAPACSYTFTAPGSHNVVATYVSGDSNFAGSVSAPTGDIQSVGVTATTVALQSSGVSTVNQTVTFTATVTPQNTGTSVPTGTVLFTYAYPTGGPAGILCSSSGVSVTTTAGVTTAVCTAPLPLDGSPTITAQYSGDTNFGSSTTTKPQTVGQTTTTTSVVPSPPSLSVNQGVTFTATVAATIPWIAGATTPTGTVSFSYSLSGNPSVNLCTNVALSTAGGVTTAVCAGQALPTAGSYVVTATYSSDTNFKASNGTTTTSPLIVAPSPTTTTLVSSPPSSAVNQSVTFTATVTPTYSGTSKPATAGTVTFTNTTSSTTLCSGIAVVNGANGTTAVCSFTFATAGTYDIVATYSPNTDTNFTGSASGATGDVQRVGSGATSIAVVSSLPNGSFVNQQVAYSATISFVSSGSTMPTGTVTYYENGTALPGCAFTATTAAPFTGGSVPACPAAFATAGKYSITAVYSGDTNFSGATSTAISQTVNTTATTTTVVSSPNPSAVNAPVTFTATVTPAYTAGTTPSSPTGTVTFTNTTSGTALPCSPVSVATSANVTTAVCKYTFTASGSYDIVATYTSGDTNFAGSASGATADVQSVGVQGTTVALTSSLPSPAGSTVNQPVTFNATINLSSGTTTNPTGIITYSDGATVLCTFGTKAAPATFTGGVVPVCTATLLTATSTTVTHAITASYSGDSNFGASTGNLTQIVIPETTATTVAAAPVSPVALNTPVTFTASVTPSQNVVATNSPTGTVTFSFGSTNLCTGVGVAAAAGSAAGSATAACTVTLPTTGTYPVIATYSADANFSGSASSVLNFVVGQTPTTLSLSSSLPNAVVVSQLVTFTARVVSGNAGAVAPNGTVAFSSNDVSTTSPAGTAGQCIAQPVTPIANANATGFDGVAHCSVQFPINAQFTAPVTVTATYQPATSPQEFSTSTNTFVQTVQNYSVAFTAPVSATSPALTPVFVTQGYSNISDPFNPKTNITVQVTSSGGFTDTLTVTCSVTAVSVTNIPAGQAVSDPSCTPIPLTSSTLSGGTGSTLSYTVSASAAAPIGQYNVTIAAADTSKDQTVTNGGAPYSLSQKTAQPVLVYVVGQSNGLTLAGGATGTGNAVFDTTPLPPPLNAPTTLESFACGTVVPVAAGTLGTPIKNSGLVCTGPKTGPASPATTLGDETEVAITISTAGQSAQLMRSSTTALAAFLGLPLFAFLGWVGSRKSPRRNFFQFIGLILLMVGAAYAVTGCGGSFNQPSAPSNGVLPAGSYLVQVVATDDQGANYYAVMPLTVNPNNR